MAWTTDSIVCLQVTTVDPKTAAVGKEPLETLHSFRSGGGLGWAEAAGALDMVARRRESGLHQVCLHNAAWQLLISRPGPPAHTSTVLLLGRFYSL